LNLIGCIDAPTRGTVEVCGEETARLRDDGLADFRARNVGFIFQNFSLVPVLSAFENVEYPLLLVGMPSAERRERTFAMLEAVGLTRQARQRPNQRGDVKAFQDRTAVPVERAIGIQEPDFFLDTERSRNVLNSGLRDLFDWQESTDRLKDLQLHKQRHLG
jgi:putative ABC transport system ATP-binding protein